MTPTCMLSVMTSFMTVCAVLLAVAVAWLYPRCLFWATCAHSSPIGRGLVFIKTPKAAGSTLAGICRRIGARRGYAKVRDSNWLTAESWWKGLCARGNARGGVCPAAVWANHGTRIATQDTLDDLMPGAVYVASVRDPASRCLSAYYHDLGRHNLEDDLESKLSWMSRCGRDAQTQYLRTEDSQSVPDVFSSYDVVVVVERFDESLVAFRGRLNASLVDMLYLKSKVSGNEPTGRDDRRQTQPGRKYPAHPPLEQEPALVRRLASTWEHSADAELVRLAIAALDRQVAACLRSVHV